MSQTKKGKVLNPDTNRYVGINTKKGKELLASAAKTKVSAKKQKTIEVLISTDSNGFGMTKQVVDLYKKETGNKFDKFNHYEYHEDVKYRSDPKLISIVRKLGSKAVYKDHTIDIVTIPVIFKDCFQIYTVEEFDSHIDYNKSEEIDLSPDLLVLHLLKTKNLGIMTPEASKRFLSRIQKIMSTEYKSELVESFSN